MSLALVCARCGHTSGDHRAIPTPQKMIYGICMVSGCCCEQFEPKADQFELREPRGDAR